MGCLSCGRGFHAECRKCSKGKCHPAPKEVSEKKILRGVGRPLKEPHEMKDAASTGRKRAATLYPIFENKPCEWRQKKNCGGGLKPILGCIDGLQIDRHHGPVKDTRRNETGNVHRICKKCHNRWHTLNDDIYDEEVYQKLLHAPKEATLEELANNEVWWTMNKKERELVRRGTD